MSGTRADARKRRMTETELAEYGAKNYERVKQDNRRREVLRDALAEVWSGASTLDAEAVLDHLHDRGASLTVHGA